MSREHLDVVYAPWKQVGLIPDAGMKDAARGHVDGGQQTVLTPHARLVDELRALSIEEGFTIHVYWKPAFLADRILVHDKGGWLGGLSKEFWSAFDNNDAIERIVTGKMRK